MKNYTGLEIAIIGMGGRFPGANDIDSFWENLRNGVESVEFFSREELLEEGADPAVVDAASYVRANAHIKGKEYFDAAFFGYLPAEAQLMDPQMRLFHEICWTALEDAGCNPHTPGNKIGLFAGGASNVNWEVYALTANKEGLIDDFSAFNLRNINFLSSHISYLLDLSGPSITCNTACSTSLVAIQRACMSLLLRECNIALAGGVFISTRPGVGYSYQEGMIHSADGHCRAFDAAASGTIIGDGAGVVVLKRLEDAIKEGDHIHAIIKGSAVNNDGSQKIGYTAPSVEGQSKVIIKAMQMAKIDPTTISYVEAHGTGTRLGDPVEMAGLTKAFHTDKKQFCGIGSVKTNVGHLDTAAGVAGLIKTVLSLQHGELVPSLHYRTANPEIDFENSPFYVNTTLKEWPRNGHPRRAGVSSFGIGGTNAHVVLEEAPAREAGSNSRSHQLLLLSGKTPGALERNASRLLRYLQQDGPQAALSDIAYTLQVGRESFNYRKMLVCDSRSAAITMLSAPSLLSGGGAYNAEKRTVGVAFMFPGQGAQYNKMCEGLYQEEVVFRNVVDQCLAIISHRYQKDIGAVLFGSDQQIDQTAYTQPCLFIVEYALSQLLLHWGLRPAMMIGHSIGEYVAACLSGVFSLADALHLVVKRGEWMQSAPAGKMLSVSVAESLLQELLQERTGLSLAAVNGPSSCVVSGSAEAIGSLKILLEQQGHVCRELRTSHAFHSYMMDEVLEGFRGEFKGIVFGKMQLPFLSNVTGQEAKEAAVCTADYWVRHLRSPVRFADGISSLLSLVPQAVLLEVGPGKVLSTLAGIMGQEAIATVRGGKETGEDGYYLSAGLGQLWERGVAINWVNYYEGERRLKVPLPGYSFEQVKYPVHVDAYKLLQGQPENGKTGAFTQRSLSDWFYVPVWKQSLLPRTINKENNTDKKILIFGDSDGASMELASALRAAGKAVTMVCRGTSFLQRSAQEYELHPPEEAGYAQLAAALTACGQEPVQIIHMWSLGIAADDAGCCYSLSAIVKTWSQQCRELVLVSEEGQLLRGEEEADPMRTMGQGLLKVIGQEYPDICPVHIDINLSGSREKVVGLLMRELEVLSRGAVISHRNGQRWIEQYDAVQIASPLPAFREGGVYLITGGLGNLGYTISKYLLTKYNARLILLGRTVVQEGEKNRRYEELNSLGHLRYMVCNISDEKMLKEAIVLSEAELGTLDGVIHAAGVVGGRSIGLIGELKQEDYAVQFAAKINGLDALSSVLGNRALDFCIATSSLSTVLGGLGFGAYAPANKYMDQFIKRGVGKGTLSNWVSVSLDGLDFDSSVSEQEITGAELCEVLERVLSYKELAHIVVSKADLPARLERWITGNIGNIDTNSSTETEAFPATLSGVQDQLQLMWDGFFGQSGIATTADFFEIGGDSLKALTMLSRIHKLFAVDISIRDFYAHATIAAQAALIISKLHEHIATRRSASIPVAEKADLYPLSSAQRRMYFLHAFDKEALTYNMPHVIRLVGILDPAKIRGCFEQLIARHEILRTSFELSEGQVMQSVHEAGAGFEMAYYETDEAGIAAAVSDFIRPFDLGQSPLLRVGLIRIDKESHVLLVDMHHVVTDGVSLDILVNDFTRFYKGTPLPALSIQYKDYAQWQQSESEQQRISVQKEYWLSQYKDLPEPLNLPTDDSRPAIKSTEGTKRIDELSAVLTSGLKKLAEKEEVSMFMLLLSLYHILLSKLSNQHDIVIGTPTAGRLHADLEGVMGMFVNTLPLRNRSAETQTFRSFLQQVKTNALSGFDNQEYQYEDIVESLGVIRDMSRNPLFDVMFSYENFEDAALDLEALQLKPYNRKHEISRFDLTLIAGEENDRISMNFEYSTVLFRQETIARMAVYFKRIVAAVIADANISLKDIDILDRTERDRLLKTFNDTAFKYPSHKTVIDLFEEQACRTPDATALILGQTTMSYKELQTLSDQLAICLHGKYAIGAGDQVGVILDRSMELIPVLLGILKTGAAYIPIDPAYPEGRVALILRDAAVKLVLDEERKDLLLQEAATYEGSTLPARPVGSSLAYVIYTSGSTGQPKGVMIAHQSLINYLRFGASHYIHDKGETIFSLHSSISFDLTVTSLFLPLISGHKLKIFGGGNHPGVIAEVILDEEVNVIKLTPSHLKLIRGITVTARPIKFIIGGEQLERSVAQSVSAQYEGQATLYNEYGPTEATVGCMLYTYDPQEVSTSVPIGKPIWNTQLYVLDHYLQPVAMGVAGELYIGGAGLALGYVNNEELTAAKFIDNPFEAGGRLYRTGDQVRMLSWDKMGYLGRLDDQVKLRGYRIELGEIAEVMRTYAGVTDSVVVLKGEEGDQYLCGYYVSADRIDESRLKVHLQEQLPVYMIPDHIMRLEAIPLTDNGKVDQKALPDVLIVAGDNYIAPCGEIEEQLADIWSEVLRLDKAIISVNRSFFELGGNSLRAILLTNRIRKELAVEISLQKMFGAATIQALHQIILLSRQTAYVAIGVAEKTDLYPLSSAQRRMYFLHELDKAALTYNMPQVIRLEGILDATRIQSCFEQLIARHEILRTSFELSEGQVMQRVHETGAGFEMAYYETDEAEIAAVVNSFVRPFDLGQPPLLRAGLIRIGATNHVLLVDMHHVVTDGVSMDILVNDFTSFYKGATLPVLRIQYKDYAQWQQSQGEQQRISAQKDFWMSQFKALPEPLHLPADHHRPLIKSTEGSGLAEELSREVTAGLKALAAQEQVSMFMLLLSLYHILLSKLSNQHDIVIGTPTVGRLHADLEGVMGMFVNTLPLRNRSAETQTFRSFLQQVKTNALSGFDNQEYQYEDIIESLGMIRDMSRNPLFDVMFSYEHFNDAVLELEGLTLKTYPDNHEISKFDLTLFAKEENDRISMNFEYSTVLFRQDTIARMAAYLKRIVAAVIADANISLKDIDILDRAERDCLLKTFNDTAFKYPSHKTVIDLFEEQAYRTPDATALILGQTTMSYIELQTLSDQLAICLHGKYAIGAGDQVGVILDRSMELIPVLLGILKTGAAYIPIDPAYPEGRVALILRDAAVKLVLDEERKDLLLQEAATYAGSTLPARPVGSSLAYVIYTSGSTGQPKGVMIAHQSLINYLRFGASHYIHDKGETIFSLHSSISFDLTVTSLFLPLISGHKLKIFGGGNHPGVIAEVILDEEVNVIKLTPSHLKLIRDITVTARPIKFIIGGEQLERSVAQSVSAQYEGQATLYNEYGPTEATVGCMLYTYDPQEVSTSVPIGKPIWNTQLYVLDHYLQPVAMGVAGELYIGGAGLALGYVNNEELTAVKFIDNPFEAGARLYRTGDQVRMLSWDKMGYLGRLDDQVKLRGYRIELGEMAEVMRTYAGVTDSVVVLKGEEGDQYLCGYYVSAERIDESRLKVHLQEQLPVYMIPDHIMRLEAIPLTDNGKVDQKALPDVLIVAGDNYIAPCGEIEEQLVDIWAEVLRLDKAIISVNRSFFELGGNSLRAILLTNRIRKELAVEISLQKMFGAATIQALHQIILLSRQTAYVAIGVAEKTDLYPLSSAQRRMYFLHELDKAALTYNMPQVIRLEGILDATRIQSCFEQLIARHEILRTSFELSEGQVMQRVHETGAGFEMTYYETDEAGIAAVVNGFVRPFDLGQSPLLRAGLIRIGAANHVLLVDMHHVVTDGVSMDILVNDFTSFYKGATLPALRIQYKDYAQWQQSQGEQQRISTQKEFWMTEYSDLPAPLDLPADMSRPLLKSTDGAKLTDELSDTLTAGLKKLAEKEGVSMFMLLLAAYHILLSKLSNQEDIVVGTPTAGRLHADLEGVMGMFVNTLPLRSRSEGEWSFRFFLQQVKTNALACFDNQEYQYEDIVESLEVVRDMSRNPLFDVMFSYENFEDVELDLEGVKLKAYHSIHEISKFDLTLVAGEEGNRIRIGFEYSTALFYRNTIERIAAYFKRIIAAVVADAGIALKDIDILEKVERNLLLEIFNNTTVSYPSQKTIITLLEQQASLIPNSTALICGQEKISYQELDQLSNQLARYLEEEGVKEGQLVPVFMDRGIHLVVVVLAILKLRGAYVPVDTNLPSDRIAYILSDIGTNVLITDAWFKPSLTGISTMNFIYMNEQLDRWKEYPTDKINIKGVPSDLAYMIYTSGSTGFPKGVLIEHGGMLNHLYAKINDLGINESSVIAQTAAYTFDISVWQLFSALLAGGKTIIYTDDLILSPLDLLHAMERDGITIWEAVPSYLTSVLSPDIKLPALPELSTILVTGEPVSKALLEKWFRMYPGKRVVNAYGPTEASDDICHYIMEEVPASNSIPIGKPVQNMKIYIVDSAGHLCPVGTKGELCVSGIGVGRGYWKDPVKTAKSFVLNPFDPACGFLMYKTGDYARWLPDGNIEYLGRIDDQVKIRGLRIELGEIASQLNTYEGIVESTVVMKERSGNKYIVGYYISNHPIAVADLKYFMSSKLPEHMIPSYFVQITAFPLTVNGKLNKNALPDPEINTPEDYIPPSGEIEEQLVDIWAAVLQVDKKVISVNKNFFDLGGNSIGIIGLHYRINSAFGSNITVADMFGLTTILAIRDFLLRGNTQEPEDTRDAVKQAVTNAAKNLKSLNSLRKVN